MKIDKDKPTFLILKSVGSEEIERFIPIHAIQEIEIEQREFDSAWHIYFYVEHPRKSMSNDIYARVGDYTISVGKFESYESAKEFLQQYFNCVNFAAPM